MDREQEYRTTELVATFRPVGKLDGVSVVVTGRDLPTDLEIEEWAEDDVEGLVGTIEIERYPLGWVDNLRAQDAYRVQEDW